MPSDVTLVITCCGRDDLYDRAITSFDRNAWVPPDAKCDRCAGTGTMDSGGFTPWDASISIRCLCTYIDQIIAEDNPRVGQIANIDRAYAKVETPYIMHAEDDWEFYRPSFIEESKKILEAYPDILMVWLRAHDDTNGHPIEKLPQYPFETLAWDYRGYHGFTFNPGLRRLADYKLIGKYQNVTPSVIGKDWQGELKIGEFYKARGFRAAILPDGYVRHIGGERTVR